MMVYEDWKADLERQKQEDARRIAEQRAAEEQAWLDEQQRQRATPPQTLAALVPSQVAPVSQQQLMEADVNRINRENDPYVDRNARLSGLLEGSQTTGSWTQGESGRPLLTMEGKGGAGFQSLGKYATPQEFVNAAPDVFAKVNPDLAGQYKQQSPQEKFLADISRQAMQVLQDPSIPMAQKIQAYQALNKGQDLASVKQQAEIKNINAKTAEIERGEGGKDPEKVALYKMYQSMPDGADKDAFGRMIGASEGAGVKLKPGERYNSTTGEVELVKGSEGWRKQEAAKLKSGVEKQALSSSFSEVARRVSDMESKGYDAATGWWDAMAPVWMTINPSDKSDARSRIKNLQEYLQTKGLLDLRKSGVAPGSVTEREWSKFAAMIGNVDPELSDKAFGEEIARIKTVMEAFKPPADDGQIPPVGGGSLTPAEQSRLDELKAKYGR